MTKIPPRGLLKGGDRAFAPFLEGFYLDLALVKVLATWDAEIRSNLSNNSEKLGDKEGRSQIFVLDVQLLGWDHLGDFAHDSNAFGKEVLGLEDRERNNSTHLFSIINFSQIFGASSNL